MPGKFSQKKSTKPHSFIDKHAHAHAVLAAPEEPRAQASCCAAALYPLGEHGKHPVCRAVEAFRIDVRPPDLPSAATVRTPPPWPRAGVLPTTVRAGAMKRQGGLKHRARGRWVERTDAWEMPCSPAKSSRFVRAAAFHAHPGHRPVAGFWGGEAQPRRHAHSGQAHGV